MITATLLVGCGGGGGSSNPVEDNINGNNGTTTDPIQKPPTTEDIVQSGTLAIERLSNLGVKHYDYSTKPYPLGDLVDNKPQYKNAMNKTGRLVKEDFNIANPHAPKEFLQIANKFNGVPVNEISFTNPNGDRHSGFLDTDLFYFDPYKSPNFERDALAEYEQAYNDYLEDYKEWMADSERDPDSAPTPPAFDPSIYKISDIIQMKARYSSITSVLSSTATPTISAYGDYDYENRGLAFIYSPHNHSYYAISNASNNLQDDLITRPKVEQQVLNYQDENGKWKTEILVTVQNENSENANNGYTQGGKSNPNESLKQSYIYELVDLSSDDSTAHIYANFPKAYAFSDLLRFRLNGQTCDLNTSAKRYCFPANSFAYRLKASYSPELFIGTIKETRPENSIAVLMNNWLKHYIYDEDTNYVGIKNQAFTTHFKATEKTSNTRLMYLDPFGLANDENYFSTLPLPSQIVFSYHNQLYKGYHYPTLDYIQERDETANCTVNSKDSDCVILDHHDVSGRFLGSRWIYNETAHKHLHEKITDNIGN